MTRVARDSWRSSALILSLLAVASGCYQTTNVGGDDVPGIIAQDGVTLALPDGAIPVTFCGGNACVDGQECCFATSQCVAIGDLAACPRPADPQACASNSQCRSGYYCANGGYVPSSCTGIGTCSPRADCGYCVGPNCNDPVCGCDGRVYAGAAACHAGVRTVWWQNWPGDDVLIFFISS